jgi:hypothetical protein
VNPSYSDITSRLGPPLWYDQNACPRYEPFDPKYVTVYGGEVVLLRIACQACHKHSLVAVHAADLSDLITLKEQFGGVEHLELITIEELKQLCRLTPDKLSFGDAPNDVYAHEIPHCSGTTMGSVTVGVEQWWVRDKFDWRRDQELEQQYRILEDY